MIRGGVNFRMGHWWIRLTVHCLLYNFSAALLKLKKYYFVKANISKSLPFWPSVGQHEGHLACRKGIWPLKNLLFFTNTKRLPVGELVWAELVCDVVCIIVLLASLAFFVGQFDILNIDQSAECCILVFSLTQHTFLSQVVIITASCWPKTGSYKSNTLQTVSVFNLCYSNFVCSWWMVAFLFC